MTTTDCAALLAAVLVAGHFVSLTLAGWRCRRGGESMAPPATAPGITLVRPLRGVESHSRATLAASLSLDYPAHEVLFCVADGDDPPVASVINCRNFHIASVPVVGIAIVVPSKCA